MDWLWSSALSFLWMIVVLGAASLIANGIAAIANGIAACGRPSEDEMKRRAEENARLQRASEDRQQQYWKERHKHENPQCEVCKKEEEEKKQMEGLSDFMNKPIF
jgi:hypothetical protein